MDLNKTPKIVRLAYYILVNIIALPIAILLIPFRLFRVKFVRIVDNRIGHLAANTFVFLRRIELGIIDRNIRFIGIAGTKPCNIQMLCMFKRIMKIIQLPYFVYNNMVFRTLSTKNSILNWLGLYNELPFDSNEFPEFDVEPGYKEKKNKLRFTKEEEQHGRDELKKIGISAKDWFICFHARDSKYLSGRIKHINLSYHDHRDSDIRNYLKAAEYIAGKGGYSIRMGAIVEKKLPEKITKNKRIIDYAVKHRSDFGDIYLPAHCRFFLGDGCGINQVAQIFNVPVAWANRTPLEMPPFARNDLFILKKLYLIKERRYLSFRETLDMGLGYALSGGDFEKAGVRLDENTPEEILDLVVEMNERLDGTWKAAKEDEQLQKKFKALFGKDSHCYSFPGRMGAVFLRKNKWMLE
ncbi:MAG: TIGR04372 family glycosyltransferase [Candidatus Woesearchaeota archaeon]|nr:TIGR04372 family glycosyltransferase [Candidatus Woesearchaeota archaeon]